MSPVTPSGPAVTSIAPVAYQRVRLTSDFGRD
jgi:hypothetical protein